MRRCRPLRERFDEKWREDPATGCWVWQRYIGSHGYGEIGLGREGEGTETAHRVAVMLYRGPIPPGAYVLHRCDNRACVNPDHLFLGSQSDNVRDMAEKGRARHWGGGKRGEAHAGAKLSDEAVREIRRSSALHHEIAQQFGVSRSLISLVRRGRAWRHVG